MKKSSSKKKNVYQKMKKVHQKKPRKETKKFPQKKN